MSSSNTHARIFGTDGIRGRYGEGWLSPDAVSALGKAIGKVWTARGTNRRALVGHDGRASGPELERALARGLGTAGFETTSAGLITTPGLALFGRGGDFALTAMISASHNPAEDNGIKLFAAEGDKLPDEVELEIERQLLADTTPVTEGVEPKSDPSIEESYVRYLLDAAVGLQLEGMTVVLDCANGGGSHVAPRLLRELGATVVPLACSPDGTNINAGCGSTHPQALQEAVTAHGADMGIALDGDGDRCILVDETGALVHGDEILMLVARHAVQRSNWTKNRIVATVMSNRGLHRALREVGVGVETVGVGDRRVVEALRREDLPLGGEQSGHIVFGADNAYIGDGIYTALRVLRILREERQSLSALTAPYQPFPQVLVNVRVRSKPDLEGFAAVRETVSRIEQALGEDGRVLLRYSGTEPLARVMVEGPDDGWIREQAEALAAIIAEEIGLKARLAIETSGRPGSVALALGERTAATWLAPDRSHASDLFPAIERLQDELGIEARPVRLETIYVGIGPGSYTGLRVGIACAQGLTRATGATLIGVPSFELIALDALELGERGAIACDARAGSFYFAAYERDAEDVHVLIAPCIVPHGRLRAQLPQDLTLLADERARAEAERLEHGGSVRDLPCAHARSLVRLGPRRSAAQSPEDVEPLYLREFGT